MATTTTSIKTTSYSSRLLIWPRRRRRSSEDTGFVLGWASTTTTHQTQTQKQTVICAGLLPPTRSLEEYRNALQQIKDHFSERSCTCLTQSLEIVAFWSAKPSNENKVGVGVGVGIGNTNGEDAGNHLPVITNKRGFPWWQEDQDKDSLGDTTTLASHDQLVYYDPPNHPDNPYAHLASDYAGCGGHEEESTKSSEWSLMLHQLNHAAELLTMMQTGKLSNVDVGASLPPNKKETSSSNNDDDNGDNKKQEEQLVGTLQRFQQVVFSQSMTLLHFHQLWQSGDSNSLLSCCSLLRCVHSLPSSRRSVNHHCHNNHVCTRSHCRKPSMLPSRTKGAQGYVAGWDRFLWALLDLVLGLCVALLLLVAIRYTTNTNANVAGCSYYYLQAQQVSRQVLQDAISWLEDFPVGFKLNVPLTNNMGHEIRNVLGLQQQVLESTIWNSDIIGGESVVVPLLAAVAGVCGWTSFLAVLIDLWRFERLHLVVLAVCFRNLYKAELYLLSALFRLFRGKKRNVLRQRTDTMHYDAMQLLVGTIGFSICIFLWTTIWVYYTFFVVANLVFHLPIVGLWILYVTSRSIPWGSLLWRIQKPSWFSKNIYMETLNGQDADVRVTKLCSIADSPMSIVGSQLSIHLKPLLMWLLNLCLEAFFPRSSNSAPCSMPLASLLEGFTQQDEKAKQ